MGEWAEAGPLAASRFRFTRRMPRQAQEIGCPTAAALHCKSAKCRHARACCLQAFSGTCGGAGSVISSNRKTWIQLSRYNADNWYIKGQTKGEGDSTLHAGMGEIGGGTWLHQ